VTLDIYGDLISLDDEVNAMVMNEDDRHRRSFLSNHDHVHPRSHEAHTHLTVVHSPRHSNKPARQLSATHDHASTLDRWKRR
jgi:hypothetical protein